MTESEIKSLFDHIDERTDAYTDLWISLCGRETRSDDKEALDAQSDFIEAYAKEHGLKVRRTAHPVAGDSLVLTLPEQFESAQEDPSDKRPIAILGHMDTVHAKGAFGDPVVRREGNKLYGPGVADMKGGVVVALLAMEALRTSGLPHRELRLILNPDEESGEHLGNEVRRAIHEEPARGCAAAFNCETGCAGQMTVGRKGVLRVAIDVKGIGAHAGNAYFDGASAIREMAYKITALEARSEKDGNTYNCGKIEGGTVVNIIPTDCHMEVDIRFLTKEKYEEALAAVREITEHTYVPGTTASWKILHVLPAMTPTEENRALFDRIAAFAHRHGLEELTPIVRGGGSDSAYTVGLGIPTVCSMGAVGDFVHTVREEAQVDSLPKRAKILAGVIAEF